MQLHLSSPVQRVRTGALAAPVLSGRSGRPARPQPWRRRTAPLRLMSWGLVWLLLAAGLVRPASGFTTAPGYAATNFATGFPFACSGTCIGPIGLAFDVSGNLLVGDYVTGFLYKFGPAGGVASAATQVNAVAIPGRPAGLAFSKDGRLYLARQGSGDVVELDPATGTIVRTVTTILHATGLATDPVSGDLFVSTADAQASIRRVSNFASGPGTVTAYTAVGADGLAFGPDGTLYAAFGSGLAAIAGTNTPTPGTVLFAVPVPAGTDGMAVSADPHTPFL